MGVKCYVTKDFLKRIVASVKLQCLEVASKLMVELHTCFSQHELHEALIIVCPHYRFFERCDESFNTHLNVLKAFFCTLRKEIFFAKPVVLRVLCVSTLDVQKPMFKITMKSNAKTPWAFLILVTPLPKCGLNHF
jgi:hypothetical protein